MIKVKDISDYINGIAPYSTQCEWDNCGVLVGDADKEVKKVGFVLDLTREAFDDAVINGVDLIITHHPVIFKAQKSFLKGDVAYEAAVKGISVLSAHTCFDCADGGVNDVLSYIFGLENVSAVPSASCEAHMARIGEIKETSSADFAKFVSEKLKTTCRVIDCGNKIRKVAVCGGAGADFLSDAVRVGADAYITGEMDHHELIEAMEMGITTILAGHFETENPSMKALKNMLCNEFSEIEGIILKQTNPVQYIY